MSSSNSTPTPVIMTRRGFLGALATGSLVVIGQASGAGAVARFVAGQEDSTLPFQPDLFVAIEPSGLVRILAHRSEMGTGIRTALPMVVADELGADWNRVEIQQSIGDKRTGSQNTDGSRSIRRFYQRMRVAGATARTLLERAAAAQWKVDAKELKTRGHQVIHEASGRTAGFGELVKAARTLDVPKASELTFRSPDEFQYVGKDIPITDLEPLVRGQATFGIDVRKEGQLFAVIARPPVVGASLRSVKSADAKAVPGVVSVVEIPTSTPPHAFKPLGGVAVLATNTWAAIQGREALDIEWDLGANATYDSAAYEKTLVQSARTSGKAWRNEGDALGAFATASPANVVEADYYVPHLAHASMEPPCALATVEVDAQKKVTGVEVWAPTQNPQAAQDSLAAQFSIPAENAIVHVTLLGGGFGRKSKPDFICEAAHLAKETGRPVHVTWTREDDIQHDYYHAVGAVHMKAAIKSDGLPEAWLQRSAFPTIFSTFNPAAREGTSMELSLGFTDLPYAIPNLRVECSPADAHVRIGWLRSVAHIYHAFGVCSFPDELAHRAGRDPYEYLMELLGEPRKVPLNGVEYPNHSEPLDRYPIEVGRLREVTKRSAELAQWGRKLPRGRGLGIACHRSFLSYCAIVVEVDVSKDGEVRIPHTTVVLDAGTVVHPDRVRAQMEGGAVFGASLALSGEITATGGRIDQSNFHDYPVSRIHEAPRKITVDIVKSTALPSGVGEVAVPPMAPALANAIFAATGQRIRRLPLSRHDLSWS